MSPHNRTIARTIAATAATTLVFAAILFFFYYKFYARRQAKNKVKGSFRREQVMTTREELKQPSRNVKEPSVYGNGMGAVSMRKLEDGQLKNNFPKFVFNPSYKEDEEEEAEEKRVDVDAEEDKREKYEPKEAPVLHEPSSNLIFSDKMGKPFAQNPTPAAPVSVLQMQQRPLPQRPRTSFRQTPPTVPKKLYPSSQLPPQPHPTNNSLTPSIAPQHSPPPPPPPPPLPVKPRPTLPPPVPTTGGWVSSRRTQASPKGRATKNIAETSKEEGSNASMVGQTKLKPLHWDKVTADVDHSTVWDEINDGSLR